MQGEHGSIVRECHMVKTLKKQTTSLLLWSQKYTKADMLYLAQSGFWVTFGQAMNSVLSLVLIIALANLLSKETYGLYRYVLSIAGILNICTLTGMNNAVSRAVARGAEGILKPAIHYQLKWNLLMLVALYCTGGYYILQHEYYFAIAFFVLGTFVPATLAFNTYGAYLLGMKKFKLVNILSTLSTGFYTVGMLIAAFLSDQFVWLIITYALTTFASSVIFYLYTIRAYTPIEAEDSMVNDTLAYGRKLTYIKLLGPITSQIDKIILGHFWGPVQLATYTLATTIPSKAVPALKNLVDTGFPKFATKTTAQLNTVFYMRILQGLGVGVVVTTLYILIAPYLFKYLLPQYIEGVLYSQILSLSFIFALPMRYLGLLFESQKLSRLVFINSLINALILISLYICLGLLGGIIGLVIAQVIHSFLGLLVNLISWKLHSRKYRKLE